ncbi:MAG: glycosyltransferase family 4 protein [Chlorobiaceae bacterium]|jgi:L-malate glycosyltransferase
MNILIFDATPHWSGGANRILLYSQELLKRGHRVTVCCLPESGLSRRLPEENIPVYTINPKSDLNLLIIPKLIKLIEKNNIDVIEICSPKFYWVASLAGRLSHRVVMLTRNVPYRKKGIKKQINRLLYNKLVDRIIAVSDKIKRELKKDFNIPDHKITVIYDGIDLHRFRRPNKNNNTLHPEQYVAAVISRLDENKGLECFISAIPYIVQKINPIHFMIVGTGSMEQKLKDLTKKLTVSDKVTFTGFRTDIPEILCGVDITIMPSPEEGMSMSALESMASAKPVVATSGSGLADIIVNNRSGIIVNPDNSKELADGVVTLLQSDYKQAGREARKIIEEKFTLQTVVAQYEQLLETVTR